DEAKSLDWNLLGYDPHRQLKEYVRDLNGLYRSEPALSKHDVSHQSFEWIDFHDSDNSVISFMRKDLEKQEDTLVFVCNFTPIPREGYRIGAPLPGYYNVLMNSDERKYGGSGGGNHGGLMTDEIPWQGQPYSLNLSIPPLGTLILRVETSEKT
ncbi:MAG: 1,4-alpha-glucan branching enzyme, partial [bacterium]|nr:1,4-alpha-glucan branching enzyme [bacterium]